MSGMVGDKWPLDSFEPIAAIPEAVSLTTSSGGSDNFMEPPLQHLVVQIEGGSLHVQVGRFFA
jgi:hypothetical protein